MNILTGFKKIDFVTRGLRKGKTYLIGGLEKSGKSAFAMNILLANLKIGRKVGFIDTELVEDDFMKKLAALDADKPINDVKENEISRIKEKYLNLYYVDVRKLASQQSEVLFQKCFDKILEFIVEGIELLIFDNLTIFSSQRTSSSYRDIASAANRLTVLSLKNNIATILVLHLNKGITYIETPQAIRDMLSNNTPEKIFEESLTIVRKPTLADCYGGGGLQLKLSGSFLIWRPYQKFFLPELNERTAIVLESFRDAPSGYLNKMVFKGAKARFFELDESVGLVGKEEKPDETLEMIFGDGLEK